MGEELSVVMERAGFMKNNFHSKVRAVESRIPYQLYSISGILSHIGRKHRVSVFGLRIKKA